MHQSQNFDNFVVMIQYNNCILYMCWNTIIIIIIIIVYLYFDVYKSCIPITSITSEIGT